MSIDKKVVDNLRVLACQVIENANSGHPGIALGASPVLYALYSKFLKVSNKQPNHILRDRFVLSAGHGSAMLYSFLHAFGFDITKKDLFEFRQIHSKTPGHPEYDILSGIESTTGPLGQGVANAVGMAIAEQHLASVYNKPDAKLFDNYTYTLVGDGCLMEGVAYEALSLAGTLKLNKLIVLYDFNKITIDGRIDETFKQNTKQVFIGLGFNVFEVKNGNDLKEIEKQILKAKKSTKPSLVMVNSIIGFGSLLADTSKVHGAPLGAEMLGDLQTKLQINTESLQLLPDVQEHLNKLKLRFDSVDNEFLKREENYKSKYAKQYLDLQNMLNQDFSGANDLLKTLKNESKSLSTRDAGGIVLNELSNVYSQIVGGAADLTSSTKTIIKQSGKVNENDFSGRNLMFGVREFAMGAVSNGIALYGGLVPFASTFFVFSDYMKAAIRLSAMMQLKMLYIFTHDSIGVGEDGPTHQSVEQLATFRAMPNTTVFRPAGFNEVKAGFEIALTQQQPTILVLTRQNLKPVNDSFEKAKKGAYILSEAKGELQGIIIATGSEVEIALETQNVLESKNIFVRVVSMPSQELFDMQTAKYQNSVLPTSVKSVVSLEAGSTFGWSKFVGSDGVAIGVDSFGASGKYKDVYKHFGLVPESVAKVVELVIENNNK